jgi:hypothetical protein
MKISLYALLLCLLSPPCISQGNTSSLTPEQQNKMLREACTDTGVQLIAELHECQEKLQQWKDWGAENVPKHEALLRDYDELKRQKTFGFYTAAITIAILAVGIGLGIGLLNRLVQVCKRLAPSKAKKQLTVMIACSIWLSVAATVLASDSNLSKYPISLLVSVFIYSLPAILFGGIALWWLTRSATATSS